MRRSVGELRAELLKAGRGAGLPLGVAEDLAMAASWMDVAAVTELVDFLASPEGLSQLVDLAGALDLRSVGSPVEGTGAVWRALCACQDGAAAVALEAMPEALWARLAQYSARTYVPETELSRARGAGAGAGAGNIDND